MAQARLAADATIADILQELADPEEYVRGVLANMAACRAQHGDAFVLIGTTGQGIAPHYRVQPRAEGDDPMHFISNFEAYFVAFHGRNHKKLNWDSLHLKDLHWSTRSMSFSDVQKLIGEIRRYKAKKG